MDQADGTNQLTGKRTGIERETESTIGGGTSNCHSGEENDHKS